MRAHTHMCVHERVLGVITPPAYNNTHPDIWPTRLQFDTHRGRHCT